MKPKTKTDAAVGRAKQIGADERAAQFSLRTLELTDLSNVSMDFAEDSISVEVTLPVGDGEAYAEYSEDYDIRETPDYVQRAARAFSDALVRLVRERHFTKGDFPCSTCTSACCGRHYQHVRVTDVDVQRLEDAGIDTTDTIELYDHPSFSGHIGEMRQVEYEHDPSQECCPYLGDEGCSIYELRPRVCREYSAWTCEIYEADADKLAGKVKLPVVKE